MTADFGTVQKVQKVRPVQKVLKQRAYENPIGSHPRLEVPIFPRASWANSRVFCATVLCNCTVQLYCATVQTATHYY
eukprot:7611605-Pyramimonas_sp.AAC.2